MNKILLFDFDGTIADSLESFLKIVKEISLKYKLPEIPEEDIERFRDAEVKDVIKRLKIPFYKIPFIVRDMKKLQNLQISSVKPFDGVSKVLRSLKKSGFDMGIVTSNARANVEEFLRNYNLEVFGFIYSDTGIFGKDKVIRKIIEKKGVSREDVVFIGDEIRDIQACKKAGVKVIAVTWGLNSKNSLVSRSPDFAVDKPEELLDLLKKID